MCWQFPKFVRNLENTVFALLGKTFHTFEAPHEGTFHIPCSQVLCSNPNILICLTIKSQERHFPDPACNPLAFNGIRSRPVIPFTLANTHSRTGKIDQSRHTYRHELHQMNSANARLTVKAALRKFQILRSFQSQPSALHRLGGNLNSPRPGRSLDSNAPNSRIERRRPPVSSRFSHESPHSSPQQ